MTEHLMVPATPGERNHVFRPEAMFLSSIHPASTEERIISSIQLLRFHETSVKKTILI